MKKIAFIGTGYVGLVSGTGISDFGHNVICTDIAKDKIEMLNKGIIPIYEPGLKEVVDRNVQAGRLTFSSDVAKSIQAAEVVIIAVGTPESDDGSADLSAVFAVAKTIAENLNDYKVICTKSTVPIGTGEKIIKIIRKHSKNNVEFDYVSNPEFLREGAAVNDFLRPDRVIIGATSKRALKILKDVYRPLYINETPMIHTNVATAEMIKYASTAFLALKISYINEVANICEAVGADVHMVARAMGTDGRISKKFLHPGPGFGGSCFPKDTKALVYLASEVGENLKTIQSAVDANQAQKKRMVRKLIALMNDEVAGKTIAILGLSFKPNTDDVRDSSANEMIKELLSKGAHIRAYDPIANMNMQKYFPEVEYVTSWQSAVKDSAGVAIMTDWNEFRGLDLLELSSLVKEKVVLDTRNILNMDELSKLGFAFDNVGRKNKNS